MSHLDISQSQWRNYENILNMYSLNYLSDTKQFYSNLCLRIWHLINFIENHRRMIYKTNSTKYFPFKHISVHICLRLRNHCDVTKALLWRWSTKPCQNWAARFNTTRFGTTPTNFGILMYQNQLIHDITGFCTVDFEIWGTKRSVNSALQASTAIRYWPL